jgi:hypothetical protein
VLKDSTHITIDSESFGSYPMGIMAQEHTAAGEGAVPPSTAKRKEDGVQPSRNKNRAFEPVNKAVTESTTGSMGGADAKSQAAFLEAERRKGIPHAQGHMSPSAHLDPEDHRRPRKRPYPLHT